jgi:hypothetical protein
VQDVQRPREVGDRPVASGRTRISFRTRLTLFFLLIGVVPMIALVVVVRLISDSEQGKARARDSAYASATVAAFHRIATRVGAPM